MADTSELNTFAENLLVEGGFIARPSPIRRKVIGCLACQWYQCKPDEAEKGAYAYQIGQCTSISNGTLFPILDELVLVKVVSEYQEERDTGGPGRPRKLYFPSDSPLGLLFQDNLEVPPHCGLKPTESIS